MKDVQRLTLPALVHRCAEESERYFRKESFDPRFCYEIFRRAIDQRDSRAWEHVYNQYRTLVAGWVHRNAAFPETGEEVQYFVNRAFEKMWAALTPQKFARFPDLKSLLRYLQMCVHSAIVDHARREKVGSVELDERAEIGLMAASASIEEQALARVQREAFWKWLEGRLQSRKEREVVYGCFVLALKPRELYKRSREMFDDVTDIYRIKQNLLARLRRDTTLEEVLGWRD